MPGANKDLVADLLVRSFGWRAHVAFGDPPQSDRWRWLASHLQHGPLQTLDAGSGSGAIAIYAAAIGNRVLGVSDNDVQNESARRRAKLLGLPAEFETADLREALSVGTFDQIICFEVIEHLVDDKRVLRRLTEHLRPGGRLFLTAPFRYYQPLYGDGLSDVEDGGHVRWGYTERDFRLLADACRLDVQSVDYLSGWLSQKITNAMRRGDQVLPREVTWALLLPLRALMPLDRPLTRHLGWPYMSLAMIAQRPPEDTID
jgi:SAM-dependent methyltransferase